MGFIRNFDELAKTPQRKVVLELIETAISSIQLEKILENFSVENIENYQNVYLIGFGKGSVRISSIIEKKLGNKLTEGYVTDVTSEQFTKIQFTLGTHPLLSQTNLDFTKRVVERFEGKLSEKDLVLVVITGGGSALFELPKELSTDELINVYQELLKSGKNIVEMNKIRTQYSRVKGGGLAKILFPARIISLIFSDVPGNDLSTIASGPTVKSEYVSDDKYFEKVQNLLLLTNDIALEAMKNKALGQGYNVETSNKIEGEAKEIGRFLIESCSSHTVVLAGGETIVKVQNINGKGGRNQEVVLGALSNMNNETISNNVTIASFDSDGWDNTEFAGAIGDFQTLQKAKEMNLDVQKFLNENNSFEFFQKTGDGILTGRLPSNVADLMIIFKP